MNSPRRSSASILGKALVIGAVVIALIGVVYATNGLDRGTETTTTGTLSTTPSDQATDTVSTQPGPTSDPEPGASPQPWPAVASQVGTKTPEAGLTPSGSLSTRSDGQVIEGLHVTGSITIAHDNVTVRDTKLDLTGNYALHVPELPDGTCPIGTVFEKVEIDGRMADDSYTPAYGEGCGFVLSEAYVHGTGQAIKIMGDTTIQDSYVVTSQSGTSDAHRNAIEARGSNNQVLRNYLICSADTGCSSALAVYNDVEAVSDVLIQENFLAANAGYCLYGGSSHDSGFPPASNVDIIDNAFSTMIYPQCGRSGFITAHDDGINGNESAGNYVYETRQPIP